MLNTIAEVIIVMPMPLWLRIVPIINRKILLKQLFALSSWNVVQYSLDFVIGNIQQ